jgi:DNA-binding transcriptional ArsR family regulator
MPHRSIARQELASLMAVLAHPLRLGLVLALVDGEHDVTSLMKMAGASQTAVSQALARLRAAHLVKERRQGRHVFYRLALAGLPKWLDGGLLLLADESSQRAGVHDAINHARDAWGQGNDGGSSAAS